MAKINIKGYTLIVSENLSKELKLASRNNPDVKAVSANYLNVARLLDAETVLITKQALEVLANWLKPSNPVKATEK